MKSVELDRDEIILLLNIRAGATLEECEKDAPIVFGSLLSKGLVCIHSGVFVMSGTGTQAMNKVFEMMMNGTLMEDTK